MNFEEKLKQLQEKYRSLGDEIDELIIAKQEAEKPKNRFWKPEVNETYYSITYEGNIHKFYASPHHSTSNSILNANCYRESEIELAEKDAKRMQARQIIQRTADHLHGERYDYEQDGINYIPFYSKDIGGFEIENSSFSTNVGGIYFATKELAQRCLEDCEREYKILLGVE